jgi:hypothetical protein
MDKPSIPTLESAPQQHIDLGPFQSNADAFKIGASYLLGIATVIYCIYAAATQGTHHHLQVLICILGGVIGWVFGLYLTPDSTNEEKRFGDAAKLIAVLAAGFGLGKADTILEWLKSLFANEPQDLTALRSLLFLCCLLIGALFTYISRLHIRDSAEVVRQQREALLVDAKNLIEKISKLN